MPSILTDGQIPKRQDKSKQKLLVTGAGGFIGRHVCRKASRSWQVLGLCRSLPEVIPGTTYRSLDLTDFSAVTAIFKNFRPDAVIHLAAMSGPAACQGDKTASYRINVAASGHIATLCAEAAAPCVFASTDIVFDGRSPPYGETDAVNPLNVYGEHKALAETAMLTVNPKMLVCRLSLVFGMDGRWVRPGGRVMAESAPLKLFTDEYRTPIQVGRVVDGLFLALEWVSRVKGALTGILHMGGEERISRYDFGRMLAETFSYSKDNIVACRQEDVDLGAPRPKDVSLSITTAKTLGFRPGRLRKDLAALLV